MANIVGDRFQITIDRKLREQLGIQPGDLAIERIEGGQLVVDFIPRTHDESLLGIFRRPELGAIEDWSSVKDRAWKARIDDIMNVLRDDTDRHRSDDVTS